MMFMNQNITASLTHKFCFGFVLFISLTDVQTSLGLQSSEKSEGAVKPSAKKAFNPKTDLLSLHFDHAPDRDDGHSAAADRTILETMYGKKWIRKHVIAVSGAYGKNAKQFNDASDKVMDVTWNEIGGWLDGHEDKDQVVEELVKRWTQCLNDGGHIWVKEGGQSDITAAVVRKIAKDLKSAKDESRQLNKRIHLIQHSKWNEDQTTDSDLEYVKQATHYIKIKDANQFLNVKGGEKKFEGLAKKHSKFGDSWQAAFAYYAPNERLDFSDTGELMFILGLGEIGIEEFAKKYLVESKLKK